MGRLFASWIYLVFGFMGAFFSAGAWSKRLFCKDFGSSSCSSWYVGLVSANRLFGEIIFSGGFFRESFFRRAFFRRDCLGVAIASGARICLHK